MDYGICNLSIVPVRAEASEQSEMVTQVLFGEHFEILAGNPKWTKIRLSHDEYDGWIDKKMYLPISEEQYNLLNDHMAFISTEVFSIVYEEKMEVPTFVLTGSSFPFFNPVEKNFKIGDSIWCYYGNVPKLQGTTREIMIKIAMNYQNSPYLWGGRTPMGIDCSGFTQILYKICGIKIPRDASQQVNQGCTLSFLNEAKPGDLAFFDNEDGNIIHVGIYLGDGKIIHSSGKVRIDILDHQGIFNIETKRYTHKLRVIQNIVG